MSDDEKVEIVKVGEQYYLAEHWMCAYNTEFLALLERRIETASTDRQLMRAVRDLKNDTTLKACIKGAARRLVRAGDPVRPTDNSEVVGQFPGVSDPVAKVGVDQSSGIS